MGKSLQNIKKPCRVYNSVCKIDKSPCRGGKAFCKIEKNPNKDEKGK
jgi:hypothetical protein